MYSFCKISKSYKHEKVLKDVSIKMNRGEVYGFLGSNGAGKTTTMNILSGLISYDSATCWLDKRNIEIENLSRELSLGYMMEEPIFYSWMTGFENLSLYCSRKADREYLLRILDTAGILKASSKRTSSYSRGMKQRLGIACALVNDPDLLILDEPTSALDPEGRMDMLNLISALRAEGKSIILSTHILNDAEKVCDRVGIIRKGRTILEDSMDNLLTKHISQAYTIRTDPGIDKNLLYLLVRKNKIKSFHIDKSVTSIRLGNNDSINCILSLLIESGIDIWEVTKKKQSLEDLFIERTGKDDETSVA